MGVLWLVQIFVHTTAIYFLIYMKHIFFYFDKKKYFCCWMSYDAVNELCRNDLFYLLVE